MEDSIRRTILSFFWFNFGLTVQQVTEFHLDELCKPGSGFTHKQQKAAKIHRKAHDFWNQMGSFLLVKY